MWYEKHTKHANTCSKFEINVINVLLNVFEVNKRPSKHLPVQKQQHRYYRNVKYVKTKTPKIKTPEQLH